VWMYVCMYVCMYVGSCVPQKSTMDKRSYRVLTLNNKLSVLLVSDTEADNVCMYVCIICMYVCMYVCMYIRHVLVLVK